MRMAAMGHQMQAWDLGCLAPKEIGRVRRPSSSTVYDLAEHPSLFHATGTKAAAFKQLPNNVEHIMGAGAQGGARCSPALVMPGCKSNAPVHPPGHCLDKTQRASNARCLCLCGKIHD